MRIFPTLLATLIGMQTMVAMAATSPGSPLLLRGGRLLLGDGHELAVGDLLIKDGKIAAVGVELGAPANTRIVDVNGRVLTPGLIDTHSHLGVYPVPGLDALADGNEMTDPTTPGLRTEHAVWPQDPSFIRALKGGVTTVQILPGSGNLIGGGSVVLKTRPRRTVAEMKLVGAPTGMKMAWGQNPRRVYGEKGRMPSTRMGEMFVDRDMFLRAQAYRRKWGEYEREKKGGPPERDLTLETLAQVLEGKILVHCHCYRADEMVQVLGLAQEMGFKIRTFEHAVEAYKIRDRLAAEGVGVSTWADWWGFKIEAYDAIKGNIALLSEAGVHTALHSDDENGIQRLNQEAAKAIAAGHKLGIEIPEREAIRWLTADPAWALGIEGKVGKLAPGLLADVVVWDRSPFGVYARATQVYDGGELIYDREDPMVQPVSDFELGHPATRPVDRSTPAPIPVFAP